MSHYQFTPQAIDDLFEIWIYIAHDNLEAANRVEEAAYKACDLLAEGSFRGQARENLTKIPPIRSKNPSGTGEAVFYPGRNSRGRPPTPQAESPVFRKFPLFPSILRAHLLFAPVLRKLRSLDAEVYAGRKARPRKKRSPEGFSHARFLFSCRSEGEESKMSRPCKPGRSTQGFRDRLVWELQAKGYKYEVAGRAVETVIDLIKRGLARREPVEIPWLGWLAVIPVKSHRRLRLGRIVDIPQYRRHSPISLPNQVAQEASGAAPPAPAGPPKNTSQKRSLSSHPPLIAVAPHRNRYDVPSRTRGIKPGNR